MSEQFSLIPNAAAQRLAVTEIIRCNRISSRYELTLKESEAAELANTRSGVLEKVGRIEFAGGVINKLIMEFCDSPYLSQSNYADTLNELVETFYYFKNETLDEVDDDELIARMKKSFDHSCRGSVELLQTRDLEILARGVRFGIGEHARFGTGEQESLSIADQERFGVGEQERFNEDLEGVFEEDAGGTVSLDDFIIPEDFDDFEAGTLECYTDLYRYYRKGFDDESY